MIYIKQIYKYVLCGLMIASCKQPTEEFGKQIVKGEEGVITTFKNPILSGYYPDPSILRVDDAYYLVNSTFSYFPGVPIFHSKDLIHWKQLGNVLDRPEQLELEGLGISQGIFAPTINYHKGTFYMITTLIGHGGNFVVTASDPAGPWSNPHWLPSVKGIDPSLFFDEENDKAYVVFNSEAPDNDPQYNGHRTIRMIAFDPEGLETVGKDQVLVNGGSDISKKPVWIEGPHLYKIQDFYYLMAAEGGTGPKHSEVIFRTKSLDDSFESWDKNPILTQRDLNPSRPNPISATGHADLVKTQNGEWWAVFLATRPYDTEDHYNIGRETFLAPVSWSQDGWPVINAPQQEIQYEYPAPDLPSDSNAMDFPKAGNFRLVDHFNSDELAPYWIFIRVPKEDWYTVGNGKTVLDLRSETAGGKSNPSFLARRQQHLRGEIETEMKFIPEAKGEKAGILLFQNENHHLFVGKELDDDGQEIIVLSRSNDSGELVTITSKVLPQMAEP